MLRRAASRDSPSEHTTMCAVRRFPWFLTSPSYREWLRRALQLGRNHQLHEDELSSFFAQANLRDDMDLEMLHQSISSSVGHLRECSNILHPKGWFRSLVDIAERLPATVLITLPDADHTLIYASKYIENMLGYSCEDLVGSPCPMFLKGEEAAKIKLRHSITNSVPTMLKINCVSRHGIAIPCIIVCKPMYDLLCNYRFVVSVLTIDLSPERVCFLGEFLAIVPNVVFESR